MKTAKTFIAWHSFRNSSYATRTCVRFTRMFLITVQLIFELPFRTSIHKWHAYLVATLIRYKSFPNFGMELLSGKIKNKFFEI
jgi:hypothetical protein